MALTHNGTTYFYATNLQGGVVAILNASGTPVVRYTYDAWGNILTVTDTSNISLATLNPLRYRGYVFDPETGLYYLQSRYYDPELGRFLNADAFVSTGQGQLGNNMFAYCNNRPVISADVDGYDAVILIDDDGPTHIGIMVQDENGVWWHFYWGSDPSMVLFCAFGVKPKTWCEPYTGVIRLDQINEAKQYSNNYEDILYLNGDYAECVVRMKNAEEYYGKYSLLFNNCSQVSLKILATAQTKFSEIYAEAAGLPIPHDAFSYVKAQVIYQQGNFEKYIATCLEAIAKPFRGK